MGFPSAQQVVEISAERVLFSACPLEAVVLFGSLANKNNCVLKHFMVPFCSPEFFSLTPVIPYEKY